MKEGLSSWRMTTPTCSNASEKCWHHHPQLKVIILSVHDEPAAVKAVLEAGALGFVLKRSAATDLIPAVREALQGRTYVSPGARDHNR
ncbi:MAG: hypothetical protein ACREKR_00900 [Candidatus Methylomirabilales bacterium]